jgi:hypothetical protein
VGKDQTLMNAIMFLYPHRFFTVAAPSRQGLLPTNLRLSLTTAAIPPSSWARFQRRINLISTALLNKLRGKFNSLFGDEWYYFHFWLASEDERKAMCGFLDGHWVDGKDGGVPVLRRIVRWVEGWVYWIKSRKRGDRCEVERGFTVEMLLEGVYGEKWVERIRVWGE